MLYPVIEKYLSERINEFAQIPEERKEQLAGLADFIHQNSQEAAPAELNFICTHNSRRSHLSQIWAQVSAYHFRVNVKTYSGGTEATAFNPRAVRAMEKCGFRITKTGDEKNPLYLLDFAEGQPSLKCFSKVYSHPANPQKNYCAIMTCSSADEACPVVFGASERLPIRYEDPKAFDDTPREAEMYDERCRQIAREMAYAFSLL